MDHVPGPLLHHHSVLRSSGVRAVRFRARATLVIYRGAGPLLIFASATTWLEKALGARRVETALPLVRSRPVPALRGVRLPGPMSVPRPWLSSRSADWARVAPLSSIHPPSRTVQRCKPRLRRMIEAKNGVGRSRPGRGTVLASPVRGTRQHAQRVSHSCRPHKRRETATRGNGRGASRKEVTIEEKTALPYGPLSDLEKVASPTPPAE